MSTLGHNYILAVFPVVLNPYPLNINWISLNQRKNDLKGSSPTHVFKLFCFDGFWLPGVCQRLSWAPLVGFFDNIYILLYSNIIYTVCYCNISKHISTPALLKRHAILILVLSMLNHVAGRLADPFCRISWKPQPWGFQLAAPTFKSRPAVQENYRQWRAVRNLIPFQGDRPSSHGTEN